ncbi:MAG TPA: hypothetical protein VIN08_06060 [Ohtaekwangia sp.]|uniref:hypothetical protein n=1 Tax=Ohtaekwangia sp. TaxID=2066019 RepID=UPI002F936597
MRYSLLCLLVVVVISATAQDHGFPFGQVTYRELDITGYEKDTSAVAVVLNEFGEAYIDNGNYHNLLFEYHTKIKILKRQGIEKGTIEIPLYKGESKIELIRSIKASSFNYENGSMKETKLDSKNIFKENFNKRWDVAKFAIPNVRVGSVIDVMYVIESPFIFNFRNWEFQDDIPKMKSEYWASIPGNFVFNISLKGYLKLSKNENEVVRDCFSPGGGNVANCARFKWGMENIPAFKEEEYMTAKSNLLSMINFELSEVNYFDGRTDKITKEWKDVEEELRKDDKFGVQLKRGKDIVDEHVTLLVAGETDPLNKAKKVYDFIKSWYRWDDVYGMMSEFGIKKAFDKQSGNVGDINLSLVAALKYAGLNVEPVILSTRDNGFPTELHPVLSDFNYVVAKLNVNDKVYLLDATDDFLPFGLIAKQCLNGKGRVLGEKESYWYELKPGEKSKQITMISLKLGDDGVFTGTIQASFTGYEALAKRKEIYRAGSEQGFITELSKKMTDLEIKNYKIENAEELSKPLVLKLDIEMSGYGNMNASNLLFSPFIIGKWQQNPFKSAERLYPVDFGVSPDESLILNLEYPGNYEVIELPQKVGLALPNSGGRYLYEVQNVGNRLTLNSSLQISRTFFSSEEYHFIKELFNRVIATQQADLIFRKKS